MQCSTPHLCSPRILIYGYQLIYTRILPARDTDETQTRPGTPRGGAGRRGSEPRAAEARGEGEHIHAPTHNLTQSQKAGPNRIKKTRRPTQASWLPLSPVSPRKEGSEQKGNDQRAPSKVV